MSIANLYFLLALANSEARGSIGQDSKDWSVLEFKCHASRTTVIVSLMVIIRSGYKNVAP